MMFSLLAAALVSASVASSPTLSPQALALIAPVRQAYVKVDAEQARLGPAATPSEKLERLYERDQAPREALVKIDLSSLPADQRAAAQRALWSEITDNDLADQRALKALIPADGWFKTSVYGEKATTAAFLIVQHATDDEPLMRQTLKKLAEYKDEGEAKGSYYALMYDRIALDFDHRPQRYGSQVSCEHGAWKPIDLEDPAHVDQRRKAVGLTSTEAEYLKNFSQQPCH